MSDVVGRCGNSAPTFIGGPAELCKLPAGHAGWHRSDQGAEWNDARPAAEPAPPTDDDEQECEHHSWAGLMALLDEHWPEDIFPTREDDITRGAGARIVSLIRWVDRLRSDRA